MNVKAITALATSLAAASAAAAYLPEDPLVRITFPLAAAVGLSAWYANRYK